MLNNLLFILSVLTCACVCLLQEMREKMKTDTSLLVVGGADEQVSKVSTRDVFW